VNSKGATPDNYIKGSEVRAFEFELELEQIKYGTFYERWQNHILMPAKHMAKMMPWLL